MGKETKKTNTKKVNSQKKKTTPKKKTVNVEQIKKEPVIEEKVVKHEEVKEKVVERDEAYESKKPVKKQKDNRKTIFSVLCVALVALVGFLAIRLEGDNIGILSPDDSNQIDLLDNSVKESPNLGENDADDPSVVDGFTNTGVYSNLGYIIENTFANRESTGYSSFKDGLTLNDNILGIVDFKTEFAFQFALMHNYVNAYDNGDSYSISSDDYKKAYSMIYNETPGDDITNFLNNGSYISNIPSTKSSDNYYRFLESDLIEVPIGFESHAIVYDSYNDCTKYSSNESDDFCRNHAKKIGSMKIIYTKNDNNYIIRSVSLFSK